MENMCSQNNMITQNINTIPIIIDVTFTIPLFPQDFPTFTIDFR